MIFRAALAGLAVGTVVALSLTSPATAIPHDAQTTSAKVARFAAASTKAEQHDAKHYWTSERMQTAIEVGTELIEGDGAEVPPAGALRVKVNPRFGKVFYTLGGLNYACSGTATQSGNGDVVTTAGHCVNDGAGSEASNWAFVPAYDNGQAPFGVWTAQALFVPSQWVVSRDFDYDAAFAVMNENLLEHSLTEVVGGYAISFNQGSELEYEVYGYPGTGAYNGETLWSCAGTGTPNIFGLQDQGIACDMTSGASGGGWLTGGKLNSVTSFHYADLPETTWGPYFGSTIQAVYDTAQATL